VLSPIHQTQIENTNNLTDSRSLTGVGITSTNLSPPFAWAAKPANPSAGGAADHSPQFQLRGSPAK